MAPVLTQIESERGESLKIVKIDASTEGELASEFGVTAVPTFVLLDKGDKKAELTGLRGKKDFEAWIDSN
jgi:thioredoxin 1